MADWEATAFVTGLDTQQVRIPVSGVGLMPGTLRSETSQLFFGIVEVGFPSEVKTWTITNIGTVPTGPLTLTSTESTGFEIGNNCGPPLAPNASCSVDVRFLALRSSAPYEYLTVSDGTNEITASIVAYGNPRLTIRLEGSGTGRISTDSGVDCANGCSFLASDFVTVTATTANGSNSFFSGWSFPGWTNSGCPYSARDCFLLIDTPETLVATFSDQANNLVFVSSETYPPNLGGTAPYDAACNRLASTAGINDAAGSAFVAGMSGPDPFWQRMAAGARGWVRMDGMAIGDTRETLSDPSIRLPYTLLHDESGLPVYGGVAWTGTNDDGTTGDNCNDWTTVAIDARATLGYRDSASGWLGGVALNCDAADRFPIYCFGKSKVAPLASSSILPGKRLWVSRAPLAIGTQSPDATCQADRPQGVEQAIALIGFTNRRVGDVVDHAAMYVRADGALIGTGAQMVASTLTTVSREYSDGTIASMGSVWIGGQPWRDSTADETCDDWQNPSGTGTVGYSLESEYLLGGYAHVCDQTASVYCVEN